MTTQLSLSEMLQEPIPSVLERERTALDRLLLKSNGRVVLFGSGSLGQRAAQALRTIGVSPLAFSDNNRQRWHTEVEGLTILPPEEAAHRYGRDALFLVTIWNEFHWFSETDQQLRSYGCGNVSPYPPLHWRFPETFLPCLLNDLPSKVIQDRDLVLRAGKLWNDELSQAIFEANVRLRLKGEFADIPGRPIENTYLPTDLIRFSDEDCFLDCGATIGEMLQDLLKKREGGFKRFNALEADNVSFPKLERYCESLAEPLKSRLKLFRCAVGAASGFVRFAHSGQTGSKISDSGEPVACYPIDELFSDDPLTFIKMDIEGAEHDALLGARKVIQRDRPILAICVYHTQSDIWRIPLLVREMVPEYKLYLRAYEGDGFQTVLYAVPPNRSVQVG
jgi:FkbM family methyltransferase